MLSLFPFSDFFFFFFFPLHSHSFVTSSPPLLLSTVLYEDILDMDNSGSTATEKSLLSAVSGNSALLALPNKSFYQLSDMKPYNPDIPITQITVTYPKTADLAAVIIKCAASANLKVQPRCGGHSYSNYGT